MGRGSRDLDRRTFIGLGAAASAAAVAGCRRVAAPPAAAGEMRYRPLGATGLQVSEVSFGAHGSRNPDLFPVAFDAGINLVMTSGSYLDGREEEAVGEALRTLGGRRDRVVVVTGEAFAPEAGKREVLAAVDASLRRLGTDRIEVYCTFMVQTPRDVRNRAVLDGIEEARRAGKVLHVGLSGHHGGLQECMRAATDDGTYQVFLIKHDFVSYPDQAALIRRAAERGIGVVVFKTNAGARQREIKDLEKGGLSFAQATVRWALTNPDIASVLVSITSFAQIRSLAATVGAPLSAAEAAMLRRYADAVRTLYCRFCRNCEPSCPHGVAVAEVNRFALYAAGYGRVHDAARLYGRLPSRRTATACGDCSGACDAACPFGRRVRAELVAAHRLLPAMARAGALRFWISRLWDFHLPREAALLTPHDPTHFERVLHARVQKQLLAP